MFRRPETFFAACLWLLSAVLPYLGLPQHATNAPAFDAAAGDARKFQLAPGLKLDVWAAEPQLSNSVAFAFDGRGRVYLAESDRWAISVFDITQHTNWLWQDMSFRSVAERGAFLTNQFATNLAFLTKDSEVVRRVEDRDGDGKADTSEIIATGFTNAVDGTAAGVLATREGIYFANIPSLWRIPNDDLRMTNRVSANPANRPSEIGIRNSLATGFGVHIGVSGHDLHGLIKGPDGRIYMSFGDRGCVLTNREGVVINLPDTGGVLRCEPDGRDLEVFCYGLRNPQELAFDDFGNLWTVDNDTAGADPCRVLHLVEGGDYGWRTSYQHMDGFGPWVQEELWKGGQDGILPPAGTVSQGPSGLAFYPGTGFGERLAGTFLHADFPGGVWAYTVKPQGASYVVDRKEKFLWNCWPTDVDFGPDGAAYVLDWVSGWGQTPRGRIYRISPNSELGSRNSELVAETRRLLAEGMTQRGEKELLDLLGHADRRVRLEAQWELAGRGTGALEGAANLATDSGNRLQRLHALWAISQIARYDPSRDAVWETPLFQLLHLLRDRDLPIAAEAARTLHQAGSMEVNRSLRTLLAQDNLEVRRIVGLVSATPLFGGVTRPLPNTVERIARKLNRPWATALAGELGRSPAKVDLIPPTERVAALLSGGSQDPFLMHVARQVLVTSADASPFFNEELERVAKSRLADHRMAALLAYRRLAEQPNVGVRWQGFPENEQRLRSFGNQLTNFLSDPDPRLIVAAGRAIHDVPIVEGFPALASFITKIDCPTNLMSRVINACYRLGTQQHAQMLAGFAAREDVPDWARVLALRALADWEKPSPLDRVNGLWRPLVTGERPPSPRPPPPGRGGNAVSPSGNEPAQPTAPPSPPPDNPSLTPTRALTYSRTRPDASPSPGGEGRSEGGPPSRSAVPTNPLLERAAQAQAARNLGRAAEIPVLPADLGRSVPYDEAMALRRNPAPAQRALLRVAGDVLNPFNLNEAGQPAGTREVLPLQLALVDAAVKLDVREARTPFYEKFADNRTPPELRRALLPALAALRAPYTGDAVKLALADPDARLRAAALPYLDQLEGEDSVAVLSGLLTGDADLRLAQSAVAALAKVPGAKADEAIQNALARLDAGALPAGLALDLREAARARNLPGARATAPQDTLAGGDAARGKRIFFENATVQCLRCHRVGNDGGSVGPNLGDVGRRYSREELLESLLQPNARIAAGFENVVLTLKDGSTHSGLVKREAANSLTLETADPETGETKTVLLRKDQIASRAAGPSAMPEGLADQLSPFELRDLIEYLASLR